MSEQPHEPAPDAQAPDAQEPTPPAAEPAAGGTDDGPPAQGEGAPDSW